MNPTVLAAIALGVLLLLAVAAIALRGRSSDNDRLTDAGREAQADPEKLCGSQATYALIKRDLFRRAAQLRGSDQAVFDKLSAYSAVRMESPVLRDENAETGAATCSGNLSLDLPPGVAVVGGRRTLSAEIVYTVQPAADGSGSVVTLSNAEEIITPLATLARVGGAGQGSLDPTANVVGQDPFAPALLPDLLPGEVRPPPPSQPRAPAPAPRPPAFEPAPAPRATASPSFNCGNARTRGEIAVCNDPGLATLDRRMASQFNSAISRATPAQRSLLSRTRTSFLRYRDSCPNDACIAQTYQGRIREISDIMSGSWTPQR
jgi:hypothetical protein